MRAEGEPLPPRIRAARGEVVQMRRPRLAWHSKEWRAGFLRAAILFFLLGAAFGFLWRKHEFAGMREDLKQPINEKVRDHGGVPR